MKFLKFFTAIFISVSLIYLLNNGIQVNNTTLPPFGKILDPVSGFWQNAESDIPNIPKRLNLEGLKSEVQVIYDDRLVPHIFAENALDVFFAQGYVTASHRLWQMEFQTHVAAGRVSEILYPSLGDKAVKFDRIQRRLGLKEAAEDALNQFASDDEAKLVLDSYTAGVNAYIESLTYSDYPIEYKILNYKPELWTPLKSALLLKYMAKMLTGDDNDFAMTNALTLYGRDFVDLLYPDFPDSVRAPIVSDLSFLTKDTIFPDTPSVLIANYPVGKYVMERSPEGIGSNNWAVAGSKTANGRPILCNDPHLQLNLPSIWFEIQMVCPEFNVYGASLPGSPAVISGFNKHIAWGVTNGSRDVKDWYKIKFKDDARNEYWLDGRWEKTTKRIDTIYIRGKKPIYDEVVSTKFGNIVFDDSLSRDTLTRNLAMKWTATQKGNELLTFIKLNKARNYAEYVNALSTFGCPAQNFVFASDSGDIAIWQQGRFVKKWPEQGKYVMDGTDSRYDWQMYIPNELNPHELNPPRGYVSSANQHPTNQKYPYYYNGEFEYYRNVRINRMLENMNRITPADMFKLLADNYNLKAAENIPHLISLLKVSELSENHKSILKIIQNWDFCNNVDSKGASVFELWFTMLEELTWDELKSSEHELMAPQDFYFLRLIKEHPENKFFDIKSTPEVENASDIVKLAFARTADSLSAWKSTHGTDFTWAEYKRTSVQHLLSINAFSKFNISIGGNKHIVNACASRWGPSWKMVVSLGPTPNAWAVYPGGQSGNPGSAFYDNFISTWASGNLYEVKYWTSPEDAVSGVLVKQKLY